MASPFSINSLLRCCWCLFLTSVVAQEITSVQETTTDICSSSLTTVVSDDQTSSNGIVFAIQSSAEDTVGKNVISMGFHVDSALMTGDSFTYEVYTLNQEGYYADPNRGESIASQLSYDFRGNLDLWSKLADGKIYKEDLDVSISNPLSMRNEYFEIPMDTFIPALIPPNGGQRSFYVTLTSPGLLCGDPLELAVNDPSPLALGGETDTGSTQILIGEASSSYPFSDKRFLYVTKIFMGTVYFQEECPSESPSQVPSSLPSVSPSGSPTEAPSFTPSSMPSALPTSLPSSQPSATPTEYPSDSPSVIPTFGVVEEVRSGMLLSLDGGECFYDESGNDVKISKEEQQVVADSVEATVADEAAKNDIYNSKVEVAGVITTCKRRLSAQSGDESIRHRQLPSGAAAVEFSMIITGEYKPPVVPGEQPKPMARSIDLGVIAEDSINADPAGFVRDLKSRAPPDSELNKVKEIVVEAVEAPPEGAEEVVFTRKPTPQPTNPPFQNVILVDDGNSTGKTVVLACIIIMVGTIFIIGAFLFFRIASRRALARHDEEMKHRGQRKRRARRNDSNRRRRQDDYDDECEAEVEWADNDDANIEAMRPQSMSGSRKSNEYSSRSSQGRGIR